MVRLFLFSFCTTTIFFANCSQFDAQRLQGPGSEGALGPVPGEGTPVVGDLPTGNPGDPIDGDPGSENPDLPPVAELKVAFLGDTGVDDDFQDVLNLIVQENAEVIMINGDFSYEEPDEDDPSPTIMRLWRDQLLEIVDVDEIAVFGALGNHDIDRQDQFFLDGQVLPTYIASFQRFRENNDLMKSSCTGGTEVNPEKDLILINETCTFGNVTLVASGHGITESQEFNRQFLENQLDEKFSQAPANNWKVAGYHFTLASMNAAGKNDGSKHSFFDLIRQHGAIGVQAHTHSAMATCPISSEFRKDGDVPTKVVCAPNFDPDNRRIQPGTGIYLDSSAGGYDVRAYVPCQNGTPTDCSHIHNYVSAAGYHVGGSATATQEISTGFGVIFVIFNADGDPSKAKVYFKNVAGETVFEFFIRRPVMGGQPTPAPPVDVVPSGQQYRAVADGRVLHRVSATLACRPRVLSGVITDATFYQGLSDDYNEAQCVAGGHQDE